MTYAICFSCGERKHGALTGCRSCRRQPESEIELAYSLALSDHHFSPEALQGIAQSIRDGQRPRMNDENEKHFLTMVREARLAERIKRYRR